MFNITPPILKYFSVELDHINKYHYELKKLQWLHEGQTEHIIKFKLVSHARGPGPLALLIACAY